MPSQDKSKTELRDWAKAYIAIRAGAIRAFADADHLAGTTDEHEIRRVLNFEIELNHATQKLDIAIDVKPDHVRRHKTHVFSMWQHPIAELLDDPDPWRNIEECAHGFFLQTLNAYAKAELKEFDFEMEVILRVAGKTVARTEERATADLTTDTDTYFDPDVFDIEVCRVAVRKLEEVK